MRKVKYQKSDWVYNGWKTQQGESKLSFSGSLVSNQLLSFSLVTCLSLKWEKTQKRVFPTPPSAAAKAQPGKGRCQGYRRPVTIAGFPGRPPATLSSAPLPGDAVVTAPLS